MSIKDNLESIEKVLDEFKKDIQFSFDDLRNYIQDGDKDKAIKEIDCILKKMREL